jgi:rod shape-determining protein MreD
MIKTVVWTVLFCVAAGILQSTLLPHIALYRAVPDLALGIVVYSAYINGSMAGQVSGFFSGLFLDFLSSAPLGMNCFIRTLIGALTGMIKGNFFLDMVFLPMILCALATLAKAVVLLLLHLVMAGAVPAYSITTPAFWAELALNTISAPLLFGLLRRFRPLSAERSRS